MSTHHRQSASKHLVPVGGSFVRASTDDVAAIQTAIGCQLPPAYVEFLGAFGGSMFQSEALHSLPDGDSADVFTFFAASKVLEDISHHEDFGPLGLVPFADDLFNDRFVLRASTGAVYFIEYSGGGSTAKQIATSFEAFLAGIEVNAP